MSAHSRLCTRLTTPDGRTRASVLAVLTAVFFAACHTTDSTGTQTTTATTLTKLGTDPRYVSHLSDLSDSIRVQVTDGSGNPVSGVTVVFAATTDDGRVSPKQVTTEASGRAAANFFTQTVHGTSTATATVRGLTPVRFSRVPFWSEVAGKVLIPNGIWGASASDTWFVGGNLTVDGGIIAHYNGTTWSTLKTINPLSSLWGASPTNIWAVGFNGTIFHYDGTTWSLTPSGTTQYLIGLWGTSASDVAAVCANGTILHYNGVQWSIVSSGSTLPLVAVWFASTSEIWAVGNKGAIFHYNAATWSTVASGTTEDLYGISGTSTSDVWAVGLNGTIRHYNGTDWTNGSSGTSKGLYSVWAASASDVWAVGSNGDASPIILHYDGTSWSTVPTGAALGSLDRVWGSSSSNVWTTGLFETLHGSPPA